MVMAAQFEQSGVKTNVGAVTFEGGRAEIIVEESASHALWIGEGVDVPADEILEALVKEELEIESTAVGECQDEAGEATASAPDADFSERGPINPGLLARQER